jgi:hypothetical protein
VIIRDQTAKENIDEKHERAVKNYEETCLDHRREALLARELISPSGKHLRYSIVPGYAGRNAKNI